MFTPITLTGRVTADLELQTSQNRTEYVQFNVAVNKGYGEQEHANFYQCVLFGKAAERIVNAGARKGSLLFITGDLDIVEFTRKDGTKGLIPKITEIGRAHV
nr:single-stranded DNA-binding protein [uncultured Acetatifactor sp.]